MSFNQFKQESDLQKTLYQISLKFCHDVMKNKSVKVILTGNAGIGKTAAAVSCLKELVSQGKKVIWISEVMINGWTNNMTSMEEVLKIAENIRKLLVEDIDAVILDDDNLTGYCGKVVLEEVLKWYSEKPSRGLFITSNEPIILNKCYGFQLDQTYHLPPFINYDEPAYQNTITLMEFKGISQRKISKELIEELSEDEKITSLINCKPKQSVGIFISKENYLLKEKEFGDVEFIPGFGKESADYLSSVRRSLYTTGMCGSDYNKLSLIQKKWLVLYIYNDSIYNYFTRRFEHSIEKKQGIKAVPFEKTKKKTIVIEIQEDSDSKKCLEFYVMDQLLSVINYAHDVGREKVIFINDTTLSNEELLNKIKSKIPSSEKERTIARLESLLYSSSLVSDVETIFYSTEEYEIEKFDSIIDDRKDIYNPIKNNHNNLFFTKHLTKTLIANNFFKINNNQNNGPILMIEWKPMKNE
jgi:hypothetical protein